MPKPTEEIKQLIRQLEEPFARRNRAAGTKLKPGRGEADDFTAKNYDATEDGLPKGVKKIKKLPETKKQGMLYKYLWIINDNGLFLQLEDTPNPNAERGCICHTNLTKGEKAYQGGELWFHEDGTVYVNYASGRYGASTPDHQKGVLQYFEAVGYAKVKVMPALKEDEE